jgi:hypothetical protein
VGFPFDADSQRGKGRQSVPPIVHISTGLPHTVTAERGHQTPRAGRYIAGIVDDPPRHTRRVTHYLLIATLLLKFGSCFTDCLCDFDPEERVDWTTLITAGSVFRILPIMLERTRGNTPRIFCERSRARLTDKTSTD